MTGDALSPRLELSGSILGGRYEVLEKLGEGGMATVYRGRRLGLSHRVAIKVLKPDLAAADRSVRRFLREARAASLIDHPNIVSIVDFGEVKDESPVYFVMEFLEGRDLKRVIVDEGPLPWLRVREIALQVTDALGAAHRVGIVHRDVKPGNIFVVERDGQPRFVKMLDFGIAKVVEAGRGLTKGMTLTNGLIGTVAYMAPEQARNQTLDARTDVYQLGIVLYQSLTGQVPFSGGNPFAVLERHVHERPQPLRARGLGIPEELESIVLTCLAKAPDERFQSMAALRRALLELEPGAKAPLPFDDTEGRQPTALIPSIATAAEYAPSRVVPITALVPCRTVVPDPVLLRPRVTGSRMRSQPTYFRAALGFGVGLFLSVGLIMGLLASRWLEKRAQQFEVAEDVNTPPFATPPGPPLDSLALDATPHDAVLPLADPNPREGDSSDAASEDATARAPLAVEPCPVEPPTESADRPEPSDPDLDLSPRKSPSSGIQRTRFQHRVDPLPVLPVGANERRTPEASKGRRFVHPDLKDPYDGGVPR